MYPRPHLTARGFSSPRLGIFFSFFYPPSLVPRFLVKDITYAPTTSTIRSGKKLLARFYLVRPWFLQRLADEDFLRGLSINIHPSLIWTLTIAVSNRLRPWHPPKFLRPDSTWVIYQRAVSLFNNYLNVCASSCCGVTELGLASCCVLRVALRRRDC